MTYNCCSLATIFSYKFITLTPFTNKMFVEILLCLFLCKLFEFLCYYGILEKKSQTKFTSSEYTGTNLQHPGRVTGFETMIIIDNYYHIYHDKYGLIYN